MNDKQSLFALRITVFFFFASIVFTIFLFYEDIITSRNPSIEDVGFPFAILIIFSLLANILLGVRVYHKMLEHLE